MSIVNRPAERPASPDLRSHRAPSASRVARRRSTWPAAIGPTRIGLLVLGMLQVAAAASAGQDWELVTVTRGATWEINQAKGTLKRDGSVLEGTLNDTKDGQADYRIRIELTGDHAKAKFWFVSENDEGTTLTGSYSKAPHPTQTHCPEQIQLVNSFQYIGLARDACKR